MEQPPSFCHFFCHPPIGNSSIHKKFYINLLIVSGSRSVSHGEATFTFNDRSPVHLDWSPVLLLLRLAWYLVRWWCPTPLQHVRSSLILLRDPVMSQVTVKTPQHDDWLGNETLVEIFFDSSG